MKKEQKIDQVVQQVFSQKLYERVTDLMFGEGIPKSKSHYVANAVRITFDETCQEQDIIGFEK